MFQYYVTRVVLQQLAIIRTIRKPRENNSISTGRKIKSFFVSISLDSTRSFIRCFSITVFSLQAVAPLNSCPQWQSVHRTSHKTHKQVYYEFDGERDHVNEKNHPSLKFVRLEGHVPRRGRRKASKRQGLMQRSVNYLTTLVAKGNIHRESNDSSASSVASFHIWPRGRESTTRVAQRVHYIVVWIWLFDATPFTVQSLPFVGTICVITMFGRQAHGTTPLAWKLFTRNRHLC